MNLIDVIIPTRFEQQRLWSIVHQVKSALHQGVDVEVVILCSQEAYWKRDLMMERLSEEERAQVRFFIHADGGRTDPFHQPEGYMCNPAILAYMESGECGLWQMHAADDDCLTPWALQSLLDASKGQSMVMGKCLAVNREHEDRRNYILGESTERCHITLSCGIIKTESLYQLERPFMDIHSGYADWQLATRFALRFPHRFINQVISVTCLTL